MFQRILDDITQSGIQLILEEPFYGHFLAGMLKDLDEKHRTITLSLVEKQVTLCISPQYWEERMDFPNLKYGILKHQLLHLALKHPFRRKNYVHTHIFDLAADLVVNQYIHPLQLPDDAITLEKHPKFKSFEKGKDVNYYYKKILEIQEKNNDPNTLPDENHPELIQHQGWNDVQNMSPSEQRVLEGILDEKLVQAATRTEEKLRGNLPAGIVSLLNEKLQSQNPQLNWRRILRLFLGTGNSTYIKNTIRRPSKRYGTSPGIQVKQKRKILVALDTSGSISPNELAIFFHEISHIKRQGAEITIVECDAKIQRIYPLKQQFPKEVQGGGGTNFDPVIQYTNEVFRPNALVYFTDGYANAPSISCLSPILWLISADGINEKHTTWQELVGRKVKMM